MSAQLEPDLSEFLPTARPCALGEQIAALEPQDRVNLEAALARPDVPIHKIIQWMAARNLKGGEGLVRRHRKGECPCGRGA